MSELSVPFSGRLLKKYSTLEYILLGDLRDLLEEPIDDQTCRWLIAVLDALLDTLPREFALEESGGYLIQVLDEFPNWAEEVERLHAEHDQLFCRLKELRGRIAQRKDFSDVADRLRVDLQEWIRALTAHHRHEARLLQTALNLEVGVGD